MNRPGDVLAGKYRLESELGKGGMGSVWAAEHLVLHCPVAVKLIEPARSGGEDRSAHFLREARLAAGLNSQHVVKIFDYGLAESTPFIAMELLQGETLRQRLQRLGALGLEETQKILRQIAFGVERAHQAGIVHRDLKPENIFIVSSDEAEVIKVLDFGIAKSIASAALDSIPAMTPTGAVLGTPHYLSPEQAMGSRDLDQRTDVWSLGVLTCECLLGQTPFRGSTLGALIIAICSKPLPVPSDLGAVPPGFDAWFQRACAREPQHRFTSARELADAFARLRASEQPMASTQPLPAHSPTLARDPQPTGAAPFERTMSAAEVAPEARVRAARKWLTLSLLVLASAGAVAFTQRFWARATPPSAAAANPSHAEAHERAPRSTAPPPQLAPEPAAPEPAPPQSAPPPSVAPAVSRAAPEPSPSEHGRSSSVNDHADEAPFRARAEAAPRASAVQKPKSPPATEASPEKSAEPRRPVPAARKPKADDPYNLGF